jgi:hypothetical protein
MQAFADAVADDADFVRARQSRCAERHEESKMNAKGHLQFPKRERHTKKSPYG